MESISKFKKNLGNRGITLIALVITIIVLLILAGISIVTLIGDNGILTKANDAETDTTKAKAEEEIKLAVMASYNEDGKFDVDIFKEEIKKINATIVSEDENTIVVEKDGYAATIDKNTGKIISFESSKGVVPEIEVNKTLSGTTVTITVEVTNEVEQVNSITVINLDNGTELTGTVNGKTGTFETTLNGTYKVEVKATTEKIQKTAEETIEVTQIPVEFSQAYGRIEVVWLDTEDNVIPEPNQPNLGNMTPVKWNGYSESETTASDTEWYNYKAKTGTEDNLDSHWANAKNKIGEVESYFVWIPRYAYRITYYASNTSNQPTGYCDGKGIREVNGTVRQQIGTAKEIISNGKSYIVHPAFRDGTSNNFKNGEWDSELSGIWVAKYEPSRSDATANSMGSGTTIKVVPKVQSWKNISIGDCYTKSHEYDRSKESHLMKNSEWGAVAYLTHSQYGRNGHEIDINNNSNCVTGNGGGSTNASSSSSVTNDYNTATGAKASSTGNIYGIYDLSGGAWEYISSYISNGNSACGSSFANTTVNLEGYKTLSTKYATVYPYNSSDSDTNNYNAYKNARYGYGDAILETSISGNGTTSWQENHSIFPYTSGSFFAHGGAYDNRTKGRRVCFC